MIELSHGRRNSSQEEGGDFAAEFAAGQLEGDEWRPSGNRRGSDELETKQAVNKKRAWVGLR